MKRFPTLTLEGGLLGADLIEAVAAGTAPGQKPADFGLPPGRHLTDEIAAAWSEARAYWQAFRHRLERLPEDDPATSATREGWLVPFLSLLGYGLTYTPRAAEVDGKTYPISHRALPPSREATGGRGEGPSEGLPVHLVGYRQSLDRRAEGGVGRMAPHSLMQEYLNRSEHLWGIASNGRTLRVLRDSQRLRRPAYVEFDLEAMFSGEHFTDFALLFRLLHRSRLPAAPETADECWLERYYRLTLEQGGRVRDRLRDGVEEALRTLGNGFLAHLQNSPLRERVRAGEVSPVTFYGQLLRLIYRLLFLMVAEERNLLTGSDVYRCYYSVARLRDLAGERATYNDQADLWAGLQVTFRFFQDEDLARLLDVPPLNGDLFDPQGTSLLNDLALANRDLLRAVWHLSMYQEDDRAPWRRVNYAALDVEELGSVYESLLDFQPLFVTQGGRPRFELGYGTERKSTGSYYTPPELVQELIRSALEPVLEDRLRAARTQKEKEQAILSLKVCDPACGSGHFLLAAARRLGQELARVRTGEEEPGPEEVRPAVRDVIIHCLYGVDKNPLAVDLCKVALWIEGHARGKPLTFLDHRIRCGDSLVGVLDLAVLREGIPDGAYEPVSGDDKAVARALQKRNRQERTGQRGLFAPAAPVPPEVVRILETLPDDTPEQVRRKREAFERTRAVGSDWWKASTACHLWTAAFFQALTPTPLPPSPSPEVGIGGGGGGKAAGGGGEGEGLHITTDTLRRYLESGAVDGRVIGQAWDLALRHRFFHWPLEFPEVFAPNPPPPPAAAPPAGPGGGVRASFDVVLCNPPWEIIELEEQSFFATRDLRIARARNKAAREALIPCLPKEKPALWEEYRQALHDADTQRKFLRESGRFPFTARGRINNYAVFSELFTHLVRPDGQVGLVVPTGIATDATNQHFFRHLVDSGRLVSLYDFENREGLFPGVHRSYKFSLLTLSGKPAGRSAFTFFLTRTEHLGDKRRRFVLEREDLALLNPNTRTCPVFRTRQDAQLTKAIYRRVPVLVNERTGENPWGVQFRQGVFNMSTDSHLFRTREELEKRGYRLVGNRFVPPTPGPSPTRGEGSTPTPNPTSPPSPPVGEGGWGGEGTPPLVGEGGREGEGTPPPVGEGSRGGEGTPPLVGEGGRGGEGNEPDRWDIPEALRRKMVEVARQLRKSPTPSEAILWEALRGKKLDGVKFRRQQPIGPFVVDFYASTYRLVVEIDGGVHDLPEQRALDAERQRLLESLGLRFVRIPAEVVERDLPRALAMIRAAFLPPTPNPSPTRGEGSTPNPSSTQGEGSAPTPGPTAPPSPLVGEGGRGGEGVYLPLYEAKMIWHYDHRFGTYAGVHSRSDTHLPTPDEADHADPAFFVQPWYWVHAGEVEARLRGWPHNWLIGFRRIARATDERTVIASVLAMGATGDVLPIFLVRTGATLIPCLLADLNSLCFDYTARQKIGGVHLDFHYIKQLPVLLPSVYIPEDLRFIVPRVLELVYTSWDVKPFADDVWRDADAALREAIRSQWEENVRATGGHAWELPDWIKAYPEIETDPEEGIPFPPLRWDESRRARLRAELDAYYAHLYGLTRKQLRYILDPADLTERELADIVDPWEEVRDPLEPAGYEARVRASTFPGETFRVLKEKELRQFGEYRTRRLVLEAWENLS